MPDLLDVDGLEGLADLPTELKDKALAPRAVAGLAEVIEELAGGNTACYVNTDSRGGISRLGVITDDFTVRILMFTTSWKWRGPYTPDDPEGYLNDRGYVPAPRISREAEEDDIDGEGEEVTPDA